MMSVDREPVKVNADKMTMKNILLVFCSVCWIHKMLESLQTMWILSFSSMLTGPIGIHIHYNIHPHFYKVQKGNMTILRMTGWLQLKSTTIDDC